MRRLITTLTALVVLAANTGLAQAQDLRSPDARDSARHVMALKTGHLPAYGWNGVMEHYAPVVGPQAPIVEPPVSHAPVAQAPATGFNWGDAGIGAAGMLGLIAVAGGTLLVATQHRRQRRSPFATS